MELNTILATAIKKHPPLTKSEEQRISRSDRDGARDELVNRNIAFCCLVATQYAQSGVPLDDLVSAGMIGLIKAARRFDPDKNLKFISMAVWWIRQEILKEIADQSRVVRVPLNRVATLDAVAKSIERFLRRGIRADADDVAEDTGLDISLVNDMMRVAAMPTRLDRLVKANDDRKCPTYASMPGNWLPPDTHLRRRSLIRAVKRMLDILSEREREVILRFYGVGHPTPYTLYEVGDQLGISGERVRQIREKAIRKVRAAALEERKTLKLRRLAYKSKGDESD